MPSSHHSASSSSQSRNADGSVQSQNHPESLRSLARIEVDNRFSFKSYVAAADTLLEKAEAADQQGMLEEAFVNYLKAVAVTQKLRSHKDYSNEEGSNSGNWKAYKALVQRSYHTVERTNRIEEVLLDREKRVSDALREQQRHAPSSSSHGSASAASSIVKPMVVSPPPHLTGAADYEADSEILSLSDRLKSLRTSGMHGSLVSAKRMNDSLGGGLQNVNLPGVINEHDAESGGSGEAHEDSNGSSYPLGRSPLPRPPHYADGTSTSSSPAQASMPTLPDLHHAQQSYPSLDEFERDSRFPRAPSHAVTDDPAAAALAASVPSRPLPAPPTAPDSSLRSSVPQPFPDRPRAPQAGVAYAAASAISSASNGRRDSDPRRAPLPPPAGPAGPRLAPGGSRSELNGSGVGSKPSLPLSNVVTVEQLWTYLNPGFESVTDSKTGKQRIEKRQGLNILLLDLRSRDEYEAGRIKGPQGEVLCLEPITLREGMSSTDIEEKLVLSPSAEQQAFASRHAFDLVVLYDRNSRTFGAPTSGPSKYASIPTPTTMLSQQSKAAAEKLAIVMRAIYENEFQKPLKHSPVLLMGGYEAWAKEITRSAPDAQSSSSTARESKMDDLKRSRRDARIMPGDETITGSDEIQGQPISNGSSTPSTSAHAVNGFVPPSMPAKVYHHVNSPSHPQAPASIYPTPPQNTLARTRSDDYFYNAQPSIPYSSAQHGAVSPAHGAAGARSSFDYPQLHATGHQNPQLPPAAASASGAPAPSRMPMTHSSSYSNGVRASFSNDSAGRRNGLLPSNGPGSGGAHGYPVMPSSAGPVTVRSLVDEKRIGLTGLKNLGNSCYMNATLQCLSATTSVTEFFLDNRYKKAVNRSNPLGTQGVLAEAFAHLARVMWSEAYDFVSPVTFREAITRFAPTFRGYEQHDSQEFLTFLLDGLHEDLNYVISKPPAVEMTPAREAELESLPQQIASAKEWAIYKQRNDSLIVNWFQGQFRNKMTCLTCGKTSTTYNAFMYLSLPLPSGRGYSRVSLFECLDAFVRQEVLDKADAWFCPQCKKPRRATKKLSISRLPSILLIHLKRFSFKGPFTDKIETHVTFPHQELDLGRYMPTPLPPNSKEVVAAAQAGIPISKSQQPPYIYDLFGVTHHFGNLTSGHYTASIRNVGEWWYCDDSKISKGDERQINSNSPYVLWFRRRVQTRPSASSNGGPGLGSMGQPGAP
ncbi:ubiquitin-specific protease doa4 [Tilletia horrida]|nr:ubiquitin-specific protease doa4 [Tilletia horrida]